MSFKNAGSLENLVKLLTDHLGERDETVAADKRKAIVDEAKLLQAQAEHNAKTVVNLVGHANHLLNLMENMAQVMELAAIRLRFDPDLPLENDNNAALLLAANNGASFMGRAKREFAQAVDALAQVAAAAEAGRPVLHQGEKEQASALYVADWSSDDEEEETIEAPGSTEVN